MPRLLLAVLFAAALSSCSMNDCCPGFYAFDGITETDADGQVVGDADPDDWRVIGPSTETPTAVTVSPAAPNPATDVTFIEITLPEPDVLRVTVQRDNTEEPIVTVISDGALAAGVHRLRIDRPASAPGLFNIVVQGSTFSTVGDVRFD